MKIAHPYLKSFFLTTLIILLIVVPRAPRKGPKKFELPSIKKVFISSYGEHDAIHRLIYHGLFGFRQQMAEADVLIVGNSHAELGFSAKQISRELSNTLNRQVKVFNLGVGWGEAFPFHKQVMRKQGVQCKLLLLELFATLEDRMTDQGKSALSENKLTAYMKVFDAWAVVAKDWLLDGILPRITYNRKSDGRRVFLKERFLAYPVGIRTWQHGDVWDYWLPFYGSTYQNTPTSLITYAKLKDKKRKKRDIELTERILDPTFLSEKQLYVMTAIVPSNINAHAYCAPVQTLGLPYVDISFQDVPLYDGAHTNHVGRSLVTHRLLEQWQKHPQSPFSQSMQLIENCKGGGVLDKQRSSL